MAAADLLSIQYFMLYAKYWMSLLGILSCSVLHGDCSSVEQSTLLLLLLESVAE